MGIGVATSVRIGTLLGSRSKAHVQLSSHAAVFLSTLVGFGVLIVLMATRDSFGRLFSDEDDVVALVAQVRCISAYYTVVLIIQHSIAGAPICRSFPNRRWMGAELWRSLARDG